MSYLVTLLELTAPIGVGEMDVTAGVLHHLFDVVPAFPDHVGVVCVRHVHF